jgi:hypothetical protein
MKTRSVQALLIGLLLLCGNSAWAEVCKGSRVPKADLAQYDAKTILSPADQDTALQTHLPYGPPNCPKLLPQREYVLCYDPIHPTLTRKCLFRPLALRNPAILQERACRNRRNP